MFITAELCNTQYCFAFDFSELFVSKLNVTTLFNYEIQKNQNPTKSGPFLLLSLIICLIGIDQY